MKAAKIQLVHALLLHLNPREPARRQARIDRAMRAIRCLPVGTAGEPAQAVAPLARPRRRARWLVRAAAAAALLVAAVSWFCLSGSNPALAALDRVVEAMDEPVDRTYEITVEPADRPVPAEPDLKQPETGPNGLPTEHRRPGLDGAVLYARGGNQFVLYRSTPGGNPVINGSNGREHWLIRPGRPVQVSSDPGAFRIPMPENLATVPFVDIRLSLTSLRNTYQIEQLAAEKLTADDPTPWRHLRARKIDPAAKGPQTVSIWFHPVTNLLGRICFEQIHLQGRPEPRGMTITLVSRRPLPAGWFDHQAHHPADPPVEHAGP